MSRENFNSTIPLILCIVFQINCVLPFVSSNSINISDTCLRKVPDERKHLNSTVDADAQDKKSLIFVFDTTGCRFILIKCVKNFFIKVQYLI